MTKENKIGFSKRFKVGDTIYFWIPKYGGYSTKIIQYFEPYKAYLTKSSLYVRENDLIFETWEELCAYNNLHENEIARTDGCGYSFGCDFLSI